MKSISTMTDDLNVNDNLHKSSSNAEEFNKDLDGEMVALYEEITVMKTEVKEEMYDFEMSVNEMEYVSIEQAPDFSPKISFEEEDLVLVKNTEPLNENLVDGNYENQEADLQSNMYICHSKFGEEVYLKNHYEQCLPVQKNIYESKNASETYQCVHCAYLTPVREHFLTHIAIHKNDMSNDNLTKHELMEHSAKPKKYKCSNCNFATHIKHSLITHNHLHSGEKPFKCTYKNCKCTPVQKQFCECNTCEFACVTNGNLKQHILIKHSGKPKMYNCSNCKYATYSKTSLVSHNLVHTGEKPFKCTYKNCKCTPVQKQFCECNTCEFASANNSNLKEHILTKHSGEPKKYNCNNCKYATHIKKNLVIHNRLHTGEKPFKCTHKYCTCTPGQEEFCECNTCEFASASKSNLKQHILIKHSGKSKKYNCNNCKYATYSKTSLMSHNLVHTGEKPFKCTYKNCKCTPIQKEFCKCNTCEFASVSNSKLKQHILEKHSEEPKKYNCSNCKYATHNRARLVSHNLVHTGEKPFKCTYKNCKCTPVQKELCECSTCEFASASNSNLKLHILTKHSGEPKKYNCNNCKYATHIKKNLVLHNHIHTGEKSFKCTYKDCKCTLEQKEFCECNTCEFASTKSSHLKQHILTTHSAQAKKYKCV